MDERIKKGEIRSFGVSCCEERKIRREEKVYEERKERKKKAARCEYMMNNVRNLRLLKGE